MHNMGSAKLLIPHPFVFSGTRNVGQVDGYRFLNNAGLAVQLALNPGCAKVQLLTLVNGTTEDFYHSDKVLTILLHKNHGSWGPSHPWSGSVDEIEGGEAIAKMIKAFKESVVTAIVHSHYHSRLFFFP